MSVSGLWMLSPGGGDRLYRYLSARFLSELNGQPLAAARRLIATSVIRSQPFFAPQPGRSLSMVSHLILRQPFFAPQPPRCLP